MDRYATCYIMFALGIMECLSVWIFEMNSRINGYKPFSDQSWYVAEDTETSAINIS